MALFLYRRGAGKVEISNYDHGGIHFTAVIPAGLPAGAASGWRAAVPGPKAQPRRRKANVAASAPRQQEGGNAKTRRNAKLMTARRERKAAAPTTPPRTRGFCLPAKAMRRMRTPLVSASPDGQLPFDSDAEGAEVEKERSPMVEVAPTKAQEVGAPEEIAPEAAGELGAGAHAPQEAGTPEEIAPAAAGKLGAGTHAPLAASPASPSRSRLVQAAMPETKEAAVPTTPPRAFLATACAPSSGKRGPSRSRPSASPGSSGGRLSPPIDRR